MKRFLMELIGTFFLTLAVAYISSPIAIGLVLMAMAYIGAGVSGGHYNPAITVAAFDIKKLVHNFSSKSKKYCIYFGAQVVGASLALFFVMHLTGIVFAPESFSQDSFVLPFCMEALLATLLCWVYLTVTVSSRYRTTAISGVVIGLTLMGIASFGGLFNPAIAVASLLCERFAGESISDASYAVYIFGPLVGGVAASFLFDFFEQD